MKRAVAASLAHILYFAAALLLDSPISKAGEAAPVKAVVLDFELIDTSLEGATRGVDIAETERLHAISRLLRDLLGQSGAYQIVDAAPAAGKIADAGLIHGCNGCDTAIARQLGADRVFTGTIQKVSTLILTVSINERDVSSGRMLRIATAQIRGNTDESWSRGVKWLAHNRLITGR